MHIEYQEQMKNFALDHDPIYNLVKRIVSFIANSNLHNLMYPSRMLADFISYCIQKNNLSCVALIEVIQ